MRSRPRTNRRRRREAERRAARADRHLAVRPAAGGADDPDRPLSGVSAAILIAFRHRVRETPAQVARRVDLASDTVIRGIETGDQPACTLPLPVVEAIGAAMHEAGEASLADLFEAATWCEAALTGLLIGSLDAAAKGLKAHFLAGHWPVLYWALGGVGQPRPDLPPGPLFGRTRVAAIRQRAAVLAASPLPEAWVGDELLDLYEPGCALCIECDERRSTYTESTRRMPPAIADGVCSPSVPGEVAVRPFVFQGTDLPRPEQAQHDATGWLRHASGMLKRSELI